MNEQEQAAQAQAAAQAQVAAVAAAGQTQVATQAPDDDIFNDTTAITEAAEEVVAEGGGLPQLLTDPDDDSKLSLLSGDEVTETEDELYSLMDTDDDIKDTLTLDNGQYLLEIKQVLPNSKAMKYTNVLQNGQVVPRKPKSLSFTIHAVYNVKDREFVDDYFYQRYHLLNKSGEPSRRGKTEYKQFCYHAVAAVLETTFDNVVKEVEGKVVPLQLFNEKAASTDDSPKYLLATVIVKPANGDFPAHNVMIIDSMKSDSGLYLSLLASKDNG